MRRVLLVVLLLVLGLTSWWATGLWSTTPPDPGPGLPTDQPPTEPATPRASPADPREPVTTAPPAEAPPTDPTSSAPSPAYTLEGRVVERTAAGSSRPLAAARVILGHPATYGARELRAVAETVTTADGRFRIERPATERGGDLLLEAQADGLTAEDWLQVWPEPGDRIGDLELGLVPALATLTGTVEDADQNGVAGATVRARPDGDWRSRRAGPHPRSSYRPRPAHETTSDARGGFQLQQLAARGPWVFHARTDAGLGGATERDALRTGMAPVRIRLEQREAADGPRVFGHVVGPDGQGIDGATVHLLAGAEHRAACDPQGAFEVRLRAPAERAFVVVDAEGHGFVCRRLQDVTADLGPLLLRAPPELRIAGVLLDANGEPVAHGRIRIDGEPEFLGGSVPPPSTLRLVSAKFAVTDTDGAFTFGRLASGDYRVTWQDNRVATGGAAATVPAGTEDLRLRAGEVQGPRVDWVVTVRDGLSGEPLAEAEVGVARILRMPYGTGVEGVRYSSTDADGVARLAIAAPAEIGEYRIDADCPGYAGNESEPAEYGVGIHAATITLLPERSLRVRVVDPAGAPVVQASLTVQVDGRSLLIRTGQGGAQTPVSVDAAGTAFLHGLPARSVTVRGWVDGPPVERVVDLRADREHQLELVLPPR